MEGGRAVEYGGRPVARIVVQERTAASQLVLEVRQRAAASAVVFIVLAAQNKPMRHARDRPFVF